MAPYDIAIIGGGIVGLATAMALAERFSVVVLEAEDEIARHQTGHNSGVIHSGLYYKPGSLKARLCTAGRRALINFCEQEGVPFKLCGKLVVASDQSEIPALDELQRRGLANGLEGIRRLGQEEMRHEEPHVLGIAGLLVPETAIVDYVAVSRAFAHRIRRLGGEIRTGARVRAVRWSTDVTVVETAREAVECAFLVNCAGLQSDRVARLCGLKPELLIVPFRGEYCRVRYECRHLVRRPIYPVPDPRFPFLGVHFTPLIDGGLEAGPNAVLAFQREGYRRTSFSLRDTFETLCFPGFWRLAGRYWRIGLEETVRSFSKRLFVEALQRLVPEILPTDVEPAGAGVRAQAVDRGGRLLDDFYILEGERSLHVLNAPSPAATASIAIGRTLAEQVAARRVA
jgi:L-2-hydroxyglutarate oxidase